MRRLVTKREASAYDGFRRVVAILLATTLVYYTANFPKEGGLDDVQTVLTKTFDPSRPGEEHDNRWLENVQNFGTFFFGFSWAWSSWTNFRYASQALLLYRVIRNFKV